MSRPIKNFASSIISRDVSYSGAFKFSSVTVFALIGRMPIMIGIKYSVPTAQSDLDALIFPVLSKFSNCLFTPCAPSLIVNLAALPWGASPTGSVLPSRTDCNVLDALWTKPTDSCAARNSALYLEAHVCSFCRRHLQFFRQLFLQVHFLQNFISCALFFIPGFPFVGREFLIDLANLAR